MSRWWEHTVQQWMKCHSCRLEHLHQMALETRNGNEIEKGKKRLLGLFSGLNWQEEKTVCSRTETKAFWQYIVLWQYILLWCNICYEERKRERDKDYHFNLKFFGSLTTIQPSDCCLHATSGVEWRITELLCVHWAETDESLSNYDQSPEDLPYRRKLWLSVI